MSNLSSILRVSSPYSTESHISCHYVTFGVRVHHRLYALTVLVMALASLQCLSSVHGFTGTGNVVQVNVSNIDIEAAKPYLEVSGFEFSGLVDSPKNFTWLWLSSSNDFEVRSEEAQPFPNSTKIVAYLVNWMQNYAVSPKFFLVPVDEFTFRIAFMLAFTTNVTFYYPQLGLDLVPSTLQDQWTYTQHYDRFETPPNNATLSIWGLHPQTFWQMENLLKCETFYLYEFTLSRTVDFINRVNFVYRGPAYALLIILEISFITLLVKGLKLSDAIALYLGSAFFSLSFLISYIQLGIGPVLFIEKLLRDDVYLAILLAGASLIFQMLGHDDNESLLEWLT